MPNFAYQQVSVQFVFILIIDSGRANEPMTTFESKKPLLAQSINILATGEKRANCDRCLYIGIIVVMAMIFIASISIDIYYPLWAIAVSEHGMSILNDVTHLFAVDVHSIHSYTVDCVLCVVWLYWIENGRKGTQSC